MCVIDLCPMTHRRAQSHTAAQRSSKRAPEAAGVDLGDVNAVWDAVEHRLAGNPTGDFNLAAEACGRYAGDPSRLALTVRQADGTSQRWTYAELDRCAAKAARLFADAGLRRGDRIAALLSRQVESWIVALAAWRSGLTYVPLFGGFGGDALSFRLNTSGAKIVVVDRQYRDALESAFAGCSSSFHIVTVGEAGGFASVGFTRDFWTSLEAVSADGPRAKTVGSDIATLMFTSGTSGSPKACLMPHAGVVALLPFAIWAMGLRKDSVLFSTADPAWSYGLYTTGAAPMMMGVSRVMYSGPFDAAKWHRVMSEESVTAIASAPSAYSHLSKAFAERGVPPALELATAAGEPLGAALGAEWAATGAPAILDGYGLSELGMVLGDLADPPSGTSAGTLAGAIPGFDARLVDDRGADVEVGTVGRIAVRSPRYQLTVGYENFPEIWASRWRDDLFLTDDLAQQTDEGRWRFVGRADDMIVTSGHNVSPAEVENALLRHPSVAEAAVVAAHDTQRGTVVRAVVVVAANVETNQQLTEQLQAEVSSRVARYAVPRIVDYAHDLPRTETGKLRRSALRN
jgi:acetyl-CoA synthetase